MLVNANAGDGRGGPVHVLATNNVTMVGVAGGYARKSSTRATA